MSNYEKVVGCFGLVFEHKSSIEYIKRLFMDTIDCLKSEGVVLYFKESLSECALLILDQETNEMIMFLKDLDDE